METHLLDPSAVACLVAVLAMNVCDEVGYRRFVVINKQEGSVVPAAGRHAGVQENQDRNDGRLQETIEYMNAKQIGLFFGDHGAPSTNR